MNEVLKRLYYRIYISKYYVCLQSAIDLYKEGNRDVYLRRMELFYADLLNLPQRYDKKDQDIQADNNDLSRSLSVNRDSLLHIVYADHTALLSKMQRAVSGRNAAELNDLTEEIRNFLDKLYSLFSGKRIPRNIRIIALVFILLLVIAVSISPLKEKYHREKSKYDLLVNEEAYKEKTVKDIFELQQALEKYYTQNKSYPKSSGGWDAVIAPFGASKKDWIPGLAPEYIKELPTDPRKGKEPMEQYMYKSDGTDYKLIAHYPLGMSEIISSRPALVDSIRPSWAFGVWSKGAKSW